MTPNTSRRVAIILGCVALALGFGATVVRVFGGRQIDYVHIAFLLGLLAFVIFLARRRAD